MATSFDELDPEHNTSFGSSDEGKGYDIAQITAPVAEDMEQLRLNLRDIIGRKNPLLLAAAEMLSPCVRLYWYRNEAELGGVVRRCGYVQAAVTVHRR